MVDKKEIVVVGSVAFDSIETPKGKRDKILGGSATYFSIASSLFSKIHLIGVGGVSNGHECYEKIKSGASLVQLYTALVFHGPKIINKIIKELNEIILTDGYKNISEAIGKSS